EAVARRAEDEASAALAQCRLGEYRLGMAMPKQAEEELLKVEERFPNQHEAINWARLSLIDAYRFQDKVDQAEAVGQALLADQGASAKQRAWCRVKLGSLLSARQRFSEAISHL